MTVQFFRLVIQGSDSTKIQNIKSWVDSKIESADLDDNVRVGLASSFNEPDEAFGETEYSFSLDAYFKGTVNKSKYRDIIVNQFTSLNKTGLSLAYIDKYDDCSHDSPNPQPCVVTRVMEWNGE
jgi:hypothetical protein